MRLTWFVFTQITSSTRVYPHTRRHSLPTSIARPVTQRKSRPSSWRAGMGMARISSSVIVPYGSCARVSTRVEIELVRGDVHSYEYPMADQP